MATHSSILTWEIPKTEEPGRLQSMGLKRVRYDLAMEHRRNTPSHLPLFIQYEHVSNNTRINAQGDLLQHSL